MRRWEAKMKVHSKGRHFPTVSLEAMMMSCAIDTKESRYIIVTDIPRAYLHADVKDTVHIVLEETIAKHIVKLEPTIYREYTWHIKKVKPMLYVLLKNCYMVHCRLPFYFGNYYQT